MSHIIRALLLFILLLVAATGFCQLIYQCDSLRVGRYVEDSAKIIYNKQAASTESFTFPSNDVTVRNSDCKRFITAGDIFQCSILGCNVWIWDISGSGKLKIMVSQDLLAGTLNVVLVYNNTLYYDYHIKYVIDLFPEEPTDHLNNVYFNQKNYNPYGSNINSIYTKQCS